MARRRPPTYAPRARYRTRRSASERVAIDPAKDFGATALDRPQIDIPIRPPRRTRARPPAPRWYERRGVLLRLGVAVLSACAVAGCCAGGLLALASGH